MFKRRDPLTRWAQARDVLWPRSGWRRSTRYLMHRLGRMAGTPYAVAAGFACGAAMSFTPFVGFHVLLSVVAAWLIRANVVASVVGTFLGNPWTFPFIWVWLYEVGQWMGFERSWPAGEDVDFSDIFGSVFDASLSFDLQFIADTATPVFLPMLVASLPTATAVWIVSYALLKSLLSRYREGRARARERRQLGAGPAAADRMAQGEYSQ